MIRSLALSVITVLSFATHAAPVRSAVARNICLNPQARQILSQPDFFKPLSEVAPIIQSTQVILIGELHHAAPGAHKILIRSLSKMLPGKVCLFYELASNQTIDQHLIRLRQEGFQHTLPQFIEMREAARRVGWTQMTIDNRIALSEDDFLNPSNEAMANTMASVFKAGACERAVYFVGKDHLSYPTHDALNLQHYLKEVRVSFVTINLQNSRERLGFSSAEGLSGWSRVCRGPHRLPVFTDFRFFKNEALPSTLRMSPLYPQDRVRWIDFDYTILIPNH